MTNLAVWIQLKPRLGLSDFLVTIKVSVAFALHCYFLIYIELWLRKAIIPADLPLKVIN